MPIEYLRKFRQELGLTQRKMGDKIGVKQGVYSNYENGERRIPPEILEKLQKLGLNLNLLYGTTETPLADPPGGKDKGTGVPGPAGLTGAGNEADADLSKKLAQAEEELAGCRKTIQQLAEKLLLENPCPKDRMEKAQNGQHGK